MRSHPSCFTVARAAALLATSLTAPLAAQLPQFTDQTVPAGLVHAHVADPVYPVFMFGGGSVGDFDGDGWPEVFLLGGGGGVDALFMNQGDGTFVDEAAARGVAATHHGGGTAVGDYDGALDIFVSSHGLAGAQGVPGRHRLYHKDGAGNFTDVAAAAGVDDQTVRGFAPGIVDMDGDLWPELVVIADGHTSRYWQNDGDGTFTLVPVQPEGMDDLFGMGLVVADLDEDLRLDMYATNIASQHVGNRLWWNLGGHAYVEDGKDSESYAAKWAWGAIALDCENDGWLDLAVPNGWNGNSYENQPARLFVNDRDRTFTERAQAAGIDHSGQGRTMLRLDYDRDGDDVVVINSNEPAALFRNDGGAGANHWLRLRLDTSAHGGLALDGQGTRVIARYAGRSVLRCLDGTASFLGTSEKTLHFGLEGATVVDRLDVNWADGSHSVLENLAADRELSIASGLTLRADAVVRRGTRASAQVQAAAADTVVLLAGRAGLGAGPRMPHGGPTLDVRAPIFPLAFARADATGLAALAFLTPPNLTLGELAVQAVAVGAGGLARSNALLLSVQP
ncbi:MAG TPA: CRTAC1 family protein [Planctomycetota bacterium]